ncbi:MAG: hypothetical protein ACXABJ_09010, partial [Candidatus Heimdallarchaeaceae archaeon]
MKKLSYLTRFHLIGFIITSLLILSLFLGFWFTIWKPGEENYPNSFISTPELKKFPGSGKVNNPYRIENLIITTEKSIGIYIIGTDKYFIIRNCTIEAENTAIALSYIDSGRASIINNTF